MPMPSDEEIFDSATAEEPPAEAPQTETEAPPPEVDPSPATEPVRDDKGRFAPKTEAPAPEPQKTAEQDHRVPLTELLNERERRQQFEREVAETRKEREALQRQLAEYQRKSEPPPPAPDIFENPQGFVESLEQRFENRLRQQEGEFSLRLAHRQYGQEFEAAYQALLSSGQSGDRASVQSVMAAHDPGEALIRWHRQRSLMEKTGGDLDGFLKKREEELLSDPAFMQKVAEKIRSSQTQAGSRSDPLVQIPPSLSRMSSAAPSGDEDGGDMSDASLFRHATRR